MNIDILVIGQGIAGTCLSYFLEKENISFRIIDNADPNSPSRVAAGIINPVTGRRIVRTWMIEELLAFATGFYSAIGNELNIQSISLKKIMDFFPSLQMKIAFEQRMNEGETYLLAPADENSFRELFNYDFGYGIVSPSYTVHLRALLSAWRNKLVRQDLLLNEDFNITQLTIEQDTVHYKNISARKIIFCDGIHSYRNPYFDKLPFAPNKGEMLLIEIPDLSPENFYKKGMVLASLHESNLFWLGSNYHWEFEHENPTREFYQQAEHLLKTWLKMPYQIVEHRAAVRPATIERRPFVGFHPVYPSVGILNGMGTKGCSLAPFFAKQLADSITGNQTITPEADVSRFRKILER